MEEEARRILRDALARSAPVGGLGQKLALRFKGVAHADFTLPERHAQRALEIVERLGEATAEDVSRERGISISSARTFLCAARTRGLIKVVRSNLVTAVNGATTKAPVYAVCGDTTTTPDSSESVNESSSPLPDPPDGAAVVAAAVSDEEFE
jgi:hypothetical protein